MRAGIWPQMFGNTPWQRTGLTLALAPLLTLAAWADFSFTAKTTVSGNAGAAMNLALGGMPGGVVTNVYLHNGLVRSDSGGVIRILDFNQQLAIQITPATKTYSEMTLQQMEQTLASGQSAMASLAPSPGSSGPQPPQPSVQVTGETAQIGPWSARQVELTMAPPEVAGAPKIQLQFDFWLTQQLDASEWDTLIQQHGKLLAWLIPSSSGGINLASMLNGQPDPKLPQMNGFPVKATLTMQMTPVASAPAAPSQPMTLITTVTLLNASNAPVAASQFTVPAGYRKVTPASSGEPLSRNRKNRGRSAAAPAPYSTAPG